MSILAPSLMILYLTSALSLSNTSEPLRYLSVTLPVISDTVSTTRLVKWFTNTTLYILLRLVSRRTRLPLAGLRSSFVSPVLYLPL